MEPLRRLIRSVKHNRDARLTCSRAWEPFGSRTTLRRSAGDDTIRWQRPSASETTWLCLMLLMCVVTVLDLHASARRETQRTAALTISVNDLRTQDASTVPDNSGHGVADRRVALSDAAAHATVNTTRSALRPA